MADSSVHISGNLTGDPELRFTASGRPVANFSVAINRGHRDRQTGAWVEDPAAFLRCSAWGDLGENIADSLRKGQRVAVSGELIPNEWTDKDTGAKRTTVVLEAREVAASLRFAKVQVTRVTRDRRATGSEPAAGGDTPPDDPWAGASSQPEAAAAQPEPAF